MERAERKEMLNKEYEYQADVMHQGSFRARKMPNFNAIHQNKANFPKEKEKQLATPTPFKPNIVKINSRQ